MSTELAENQDLGPLGYPHHHGVLGFWRIFYTNLKIAQGLRELTGRVPEGELDVVLVHLVRGVRFVEARRGVLLQNKERDVA